MIVVTGGGGRLGQALRREFPTAHYPGRQELELRDEATVRAYLAKNRPAVLIHAAAMTNVARAQREPEFCWDVNVRGTERLVSALQESSPDCYFIYVSTACVFQGDRGDYDENSVPYPKNFYGLTKLLGEFVAKRLSSHLIMRTNFVHREPWPYERAFEDRFGTYLYAEDVAAALGELVPQRMQGLVHVAGERRMSMWELARLTTPHVAPMTMADTDLPLTVDMTLKSVRIPARPISAGAPARVE